MTDAPLVLLLSGPNLNLLGEREPAVYGADTLADHVATAAAAATEHGLALEHLQTNHERDLVEAIHGARGRCAAIVVNPGAFTHYAWSLHDALAAFDGPVVELHLSNPNAREPWRHTSVVAPVAHGTIVIGARRTGGAVMLWVEDNGPGIAPDKRAEVFEPFYSSKGVGEGLGIGLSIVYSMVKDLGGTIVIEGGTLGGARFVVTLAAAGGDGPAAAREREELVQ